MAVEDDGDPRFADKVFWTPESERPLGRARDRLFGAVARVRAPWFWRLLYWVAGRPRTVRALAALLVVLDSRRTGRARSIIARMESVSAGFPRRSFGALNLDAYRLLDRIEHRLQTERWEAEPRRSAGESGERIRVGLLGQFSALLTFSLDHVRALSQRADVTVFDIGFRGRHASYLAGAAGEYRRFALWDPPAARTPRPPPEVVEVADAINRADLDLLLVVSGRFALPLLDLVDTPFIAYAPTGSRPLFHERIDLQLFVQPTADYFIRGGQLFCATSHAPMGEPAIVHGHLVYDMRDLAGVPTLPWSRREPLIVYHGSLYKAAVQPYLDCIFGLLRDDPTLEFVLVGKDDGRSWTFIEDAAARAGVSARVRWEGAYARFRADDGVSIADDGWLRLVELLRSARLAPDPWPMGGGSSRIEAYALGVPAPHMMLRTDPESWGRPQHTIAEADALRVPNAEATTVDAYRDLSRRILSDSVFAESLMAEQRSVAVRLTDPEGFWDQVLALYRERVRLRS